MRPIATDVAHSVVWISACLYVCHTVVLCKNRWTDGDAVWVLSRMGPRNHDGRLTCGQKLTRWPA